MYYAAYEEEFQKKDVLIQKFRAGRKILNGHRLCTTLLRSYFCIPKLLSLIEKMCLYFVPIPSL
jgi:hypothetical protein